METARSHVSKLQMHLPSDSAGPVQGVRPVETPLHLAHVPIISCTFLVRAKDETSQLPPLRKGHVMTVHPRNKVLLE